MANNETGKSKADQYRDDRKARIAKEAKKKASKSEKSIRIQKIVQKTIYAVLGIGLVFLIVWQVLNFAGTIQILTPVATVGNIKISERDYNYYYMLMYNYTVNQDAQYEQQYGQDVMGFDAKKSPDEQDYPQKVDNQTITWAKYISNNAIQRAQQSESLYAEAMKKKYKVTSDEQKKIDDQITEIRKKAAENNMSINSYLRLSWGKGISEGFLRKQLAKESIVSRFSEDTNKGFENDCTAKIILDTYNKDKDSYDVVSVRSFKFDTTKLTQNKNEKKDAFTKRQNEADSKVKAKADAMLDGISDEASFLSLAKSNTKAVKGTTYDADSETANLRKSKSTLESSISKDAATWAFGDGRKVGDKKVFKTDTAYYVVWVKTTQYPPATVDVRHILLSFKSDTSDTTAATDAEKKAAKAKADKVYNEWKKGKKTEASFAELANKYTADTSGNKDDNGKQKGGLYDKMEVGKMVAPFENWSFDPSRKPGDTGIVESTYGYHIMYFVKNNYPEYAYKAAIKSSYASDKNDKYLKDLTDNKYKLVKKNKNLTKATNTVIEMINTNIAAQAANSNSQQQS